jgi:uncharacterized protein involved in exopolysaccharide biosynthesis
VSDAPNQGATGPGAKEESLDLFDYQLIRNVIGFVFRGVRRHRLLAIAAFTVLAVVGVVASTLVPRTFHAEAKLLANQNEIIRALGNPRSSLQSDDPTRAARELIFARDNLVSLIKQTSLLKAWDEHRPPVVKVKDLAMRLVTGPLTEEDRIDAMVGTLEKRLRVDTDAQTVTISIDWQDAQTAYLLVETAQQNFLETRHVTEMTAISEALAILEGHASQVQKTVDDALRELERTREERRKGTPAAKAPAPVGETATPSADLPPSPVPEAPPHAPPAATEQELAQLKFLLNSKKRALADLEDFRTRRLQELNAQLQEFRVQYAEQHPIVIDAQQRIAQMKLDSPQMVQVKGDIDQLVAEYQRKGGRDPDSLVEPSRSNTRVVRRPQQAAQAALSLSELADDPLVEHARNNLRVAAAKYEELMMRIDGARIEQDTARAAFKYRYSVVRPASVPKKPASPNAAVLIGAAFALALFVALVIGALVDVRSRALVESWQVTRRLGLPVLSQVKLP